MRAFSALLIAATMTISALAPALAQHPGGMPQAAPAAPAAEPLELLQGAQFLTVSGLTGEFPYGTFEVYDGVVAMLPGGYPHGLALGGITVDFSALPGYTPQDGALNLFREIDGPDSVLGFFGVPAAYVSAAPGSGLTITDEGTTTVQRGWKELSDAEQAQFEQLLAQCLSDGWTEPGSAALREPAEAETFAALWTAGEDGGMGTRWDFRAEADGSVNIEEYARGITWYAYPWAREEGEGSESIQFSQISYWYGLHPAESSKSGNSSAQGTDPYGSVDVKVDACFTALQDIDQPVFVSDPNVIWDNVLLTRLTTEQENEENDPPPFMRWVDNDGVNRLPAPASTWSLVLNASLIKGCQYSLTMEGHADIPEDFASFGYGGAFRFDETALWPGEGEPVNVDIGVNSPLDGYKGVTSGAGQVKSEFVLEEGSQGIVKRLHVDLTSDQSTRNQMLVLTQLPSRTIPTHWGELEVYAPADLIDGVEQTEGVQAIGPIIDYYSAIWGDRGIAKLPVFILPDESGVQGFMNAGMVFILGGEGGHGGAGSSMGGLTALLAHELAHLWWGQDVSAPRWFTEGMANYGAAKYLEQQAKVAQPPSAASTGGAPAPPGGDPYFYRRYLMNFALGYELPLSLPRRDELDDSAAIYHNAPACLLTLDARLPHGLDPLLAQLWQERRGQPELAENQLRDYFTGQPGGQLAELWNAYIERGVIPQSDDEDATYRELVRTPERENYRRLLAWLMPARRKAGAGDFAGAIYCANRALEFRSEPKDYEWLAELTFQAGRVDEAIERCIVIMEDQAPDAVVEVKVHYLLAQCYAEQGENALAIPEYTWVAEHGMDAGQISLVQDARAALKDLGADMPDAPAPDAQTGATPNPHGK